jgi:predicted RNA binding protein YcfA (HicA-like mRNA interferase family)
VTRLPRVSGRETIRALERGGFRVVRTRGSHHYLRYGDRGSLVTVPIHGNRDIPLGTLRNILRQANVTVDEFIELLRDQGSRPAEPALSEAERVWPRISTRRSTPTGHGSTSSHSLSPASDTRSLVRLWISMRFLDVMPRGLLINGPALIRR